MGCRRNVDVEVAGSEGLREGTAVAGERADEVRGPDRSRDPEAVRRGRRVGAGPVVVARAVAAPSAQEDRHDGSDLCSLSEPDLGLRDVGDRRDRDQVGELRTGRAAAVSRRRGASGPVDQPKLRPAIGRRFDGWDLLGPGQVDREPPERHRPHRTLVVLRCDDDAAAGAGPVDRSGRRDGHARRLRIAAVDDGPREGRQVESVDGVPSPLVTGDTRRRDLGEVERPPGGVEGDAPGAVEAGQEDLAAAVHGEVVDQPFPLAGPVEVSTAPGRHGRLGRAGRLRDRGPGAPEDEDRTGVGPARARRSSEVDLVVRADGDVSRRRASEGSGELAGAPLGHQGACRRVDPIESPVSVRGEGLRDGRAGLHEGQLPGGEVDPRERRGIGAGGTLGDIEHSVVLEGEAGGARETGSDDTCPGAKLDFRGEKLDGVGRER